MRTARRSPPAGPPRVFTTSRRQRIETLAGLAPLLPLYAIVLPMGMFGSHDLLSVAVAVEVAVWCVALGLPLVAYLDQRLRCVVVDEHGLRSRRWWRTTVIGWSDRVQIRAERRWSGERTLVAVAGGTSVRLAAPYLPAGTGRRARAEFDAQCSALMDAVAAQRGRGPR